MPKYTFICPLCEASVTKYSPSTCKGFPCTSLFCSAVMIRQMPNISPVRTTEIVDKLTNKKNLQNHDEILAERKSDHYWGVLVPEMVNSGIYLLETMLDQDWVYYNEKGELVTRTKPPQKS